MDVRASFFVCFVHVFVASTAGSSTTGGPSCTVEQVEWCQRSGSDNADAVDYCTERSASGYPVFTHVCTARPDQLSYGACCCRTSDALLCCGYLYNYPQTYYCVDTQDVVDHIEEVLSLTPIVIIGACSIFLLVVVIVVIACVIVRRHCCVTKSSVIHDVTTPTAFVCCYVGHKSSSGDVERPVVNPDDQRVDVELLHPTAPPPCQRLDVIPSAPEVDDHVTTSPSCRQCQCNCEYGEPPPSYSESQRDTESRDLAA